VYRSILVPLDGSPLAERALPYAEHLARVSGARLLLVRAALAHSLPGTGPLQSEAQAVREAERYLKEAAARLATAPVVETAMFYGEAAEAILEEIHLRKTDLVVMATHGRSGLGRWLFGSVAEQVLSHVEVPLLLVPPACQVDWPAASPARVLVPLDGSTLAAEVLGPACELAASLGAELLLLRAVDLPATNAAPALDEAALAHLGTRDPALVDMLRYLGGHDAPALGPTRAYLDGVAAALRASGYRATAHAALGPADVAIADAARGAASAAIAMATHGRAGLARAVLGSTADGVLRRANQPLLVVRPLAIRDRVGAEAKHASAEALGLAGARAHA
jgi:nucleotide-binding universal stress UspA family protein